jgi:MFS family permease
MSNSLATASTAPFAGTISDLLGRRPVALLGAGLVIVGVIVTGLAERVEVAIGGMAIVGVGAGLAEVVAGAAVAEMAPVKSRGKYMGTAFLVILPFGASSTYGKLTPVRCAKVYLPRFSHSFCEFGVWLTVAQLYSSSSTWRWGAWISVILVGINFIMVWAFYSPPPRVNSQGLTKKEILKRVDYIGGLLSTCGFAIFLLGIQWGGYT